MLTEYWFSDKEKTWVLLNLNNYLFNLKKMVHIEINQNQLVLKIQL